MVIFIVYSNNRSGSLLEDQPWNKHQCMCPQAATTKLALSDTLGNLEMEASLILSINK